MLQADYKQSVAYNSNGCSVTPLADYLHKKIFQELPPKPDYFSTPNGRVYIDVRDRNLILHLHLKRVPSIKMKKQVLDILKNISTLLLTKA